MNLEKKTLWIIGAGLVVVLAVIAIMFWPRPVEVPAVVSAGDVAMIGAKYKNTLTLKKDGTLLVWGANTYGQTGVGKTENRLVPGPATVVRDIALAALGHGHIAVMGKSGSVWLWGANGAGQLGNGDTTDSVNPVQLGGFTGVRTFALGRAFSLALKNDGTVMSWGANQSGQLGEGTGIRRSQPVLVKDLKDVVDIDASMDQAVALRQDGSVWVWGDNRFGQLGDGTTINKLVPYKVKEMENITDVSAGYYHFVFLKKDGTVYGMGLNWNGQVGGSEIKTVVNRPIQIPGLTRIKAVASGENHSLALREGGTVWAWGDNTSGQLGNEQVGDYSTSPVQVDLLTGVVAIAAGANHCVALKEDGTVWTWGHNEFGQLGTGDSKVAKQPVQVKL